MNYKVIHAFADLEDKKFQYKVGDKYPHDGLDVSKERLEELSSNKNKIGVPLIQEMPTKKKGKGKKKNAD